ncbi:MAG: efflux RND transporter periplasmic adaptor subunit [Albidovulum sp.]
MFDYRGMNQINTYDRKIAETLKSLSLEPTAPPFQRAGRHRRKIVLAIGISSLVALTGLAVLLRPDNLHVADLTVPAPPDLAAAPAQPDANVAPSAAHNPAQVVAVPSNGVEFAEIAASGYVTAPQSTALFAKYGGTIKTITVAVGDRVEAGQLLAVLEDTTARFALEQAQADLVSAQIALEAVEIAFAQAQVRRERTLALAARKVATGLEVDEANSTFLTAQNAVAQARQNISLAQLAIRIAREPVAALSVRAPISGTVTELNVSVGDRAFGHADSRDDSQSLLTITNTDMLFIDADIGEANIAILRPGYRGEAVLDGFPDAPFAVELIRIAPVVSAAKGTVTARLALDGPPIGIRPNMAARIRITSTPQQTQ